MFKYRKSVPKSLKDRLWDTTFGASAGEGKCYVCNIIINSKRFEAGHVISVYNDGGTNLNNLKCICSTCNKSMGTQNLEDFKLFYFPSKIKKITEKKSFCNDYNCRNCTKLTIDSLDKFKFKKKEDYLK